MLADKILKIKPTLYLLCGLPGSGKSFWAKNEERKYGITRISHDEEFFQKYGNNDVGYKHDEYSEILKIQLLKKVKILLNENQDVVLDYGFWNKKDRAEYKEKFENIANVKIIYFDVAKDIRYCRVLNRDKTDNYDLNLEALEKFENLFEKPDEEENVIIIDKNI